MQLNWGKLAGHMQMDRRFMFMEKNVLRGLSAPAPGLYMYMTIIFKHLLLGNSIAYQSQTLCGASLGKGNES